MREDGLLTQLVYIPKWVREAGLPTLLRPKNDAIVLTHLGVAACRGLCAACSDGDLCRVEDIHVVPLLSDAISLMPCCRVLTSLERQPFAGFNCFREGRR